MTTRFPAAIALLLVVSGPQITNAQLSCQPQHLSAGPAAVCAIREDAAASCWDDYHDSFDTLFLIHRHGSGEFVEISVGFDRSCGIRTDHTVSCWYGYNDTTFDTPPAPEGEFSHLSLSITYDDDQSCGLRMDGTLVCWQNDHPTVMSSPAEGAFLEFSGSCGLRPDKTVDCIDGWTAPSGTFSSLATASYPACGLRDSGEIFCWLEDGKELPWINGPPAGSFKQVSIRSGDEPRGCAITVDGQWKCWGGCSFVAPPGKFVEVAAGGRVPCALRDDGVVVCSPGNAPNYVSPTAPVTGPFAHVSAGGDQARVQTTCGVRPSGVVTCWGDIAYGYATPPSATLPAPGPFTSVSSGARHACGLREDGRIECWGDNAQKQTEAPAGSFSQISAGGFFHACAIRTDGTIACWGFGSSSLPVPGGVFTQVSAGGVDACGLRTNGQVECWSYQDGVTFDVPAGPFGSIVASGNGLNAEQYRHVGCGIRPNKTIECWGDAEYGLLDPPAGEFTSVSAAGYQACAVRTDGEVICWGLGYDVEPSSIFDVPPGPFVEVACGYNHSCGVRPDGTISCWGLEQLQSICSAPATCGNGVLEPGEWCDNGEAGFVRGGNCNAACYPTPCGQPVSSEAFEPRVSDALYVLRAAVELESCTSFVCNADGAHGVGVDDALLVLQKAVKLPVTLHCPRVVAHGCLEAPWEPCPFAFPFCQ